mgnify:CR=1 FL=1
MQEREFEALLDRIEALDGVGLSLEICLYIDANITSSPWIDVRMPLRWGESLKKPSALGDIARPPNRTVELMKQMSFSDAEYAGKRKQTRRERFLIEMDRVGPRKDLIALIESHYPMGEGGRPAYPLMAILRVHQMQSSFCYSDSAMHGALYETTILRQFVGLHRDRIPDESTILNFPRMQENTNPAEGWLKAPSNLPEVCSVKPMDGQNQFLIAGEVRL